VTFNEVITEKEECGAEFLLISMIALANKKQVQERGLQNEKENLQDGMTIT